MAATRRPFSTEVDPDLLEGVLALAKTERRPLDALVDEAFADLLAKRQQPRSHVASAYGESHARFGPLYEELAK